MDWGKKWVVDSNAGKTQLVLFDRPNNNGSIDVKKDVSVLDEKSSFKMLGLNFSSLLNWIGVLTLSLLLKLTENWSFNHFYEVSFSRGLLFVSINLPYVHVWNTVVASGLVPQVATWNCWASYKNEYAGLLVLHLLLFIVEMWPA